MYKINEIKQSQLTEIEIKNTKEIEKVTKALLLSQKAIFPN